MPPFWQLGACTRPVAACGRWAAVVGVGRACTVLERIDGLDLDLCVPSGKEDGEGGEGREYSFSGADPPSQVAPNRVPGLLQIVSRDWAGVKRIPMQLMYVSRALLLWGRAKQINIIP